MYNIDKDKMAELTDLLREAGYITEQLTDDNIVNVYTATMDAPEKENYLYTLMMTRSS